MERQKDRLSAEVLRVFFPEMNDDEIEVLLLAVEKISLCLQSSKTFDSKDEYVFWKLCYFLVPVVIGDDEAVKSLRVELMNRIFNSNVVVGKIPSNRTIEANLSIEFLDEFIATHPDNEAPNGVGVSEGVNSEEFIPLEEDGSANTEELLENAFDFSDEVKDLIK